MSLTNNRDIAYNIFLGEKIESSLIAFEKVERRINEKKAAIEDLENELNLLKNQALTTYKSEVRYLLIGQENMWRNALKWIRMLDKGVDGDGNKLDRRKKYPEKSTFEHLQTLIGNLLGIENFKIDRLFDYNFTEAFEIEFSYLDHKWALIIPIISNIKMKSYEEYRSNCFKLRLLFYNSPHTSVTVGSTFEEDELKDIMQLGVENYCNKDNE